MGQPLGSVLGEDWPIEVHTALSIALQVAVVLHLLGIVASSLLERQNLLLSMVIGRKKINGA